MHHHFDLLVNNGYDDLDYFSTITTSELNEIGITEDAAEVSL